MEDKKTFGAYILRRRKELGMTQKQFAARVFVTESAVSKWERGLSYPDITLLKSLCEVLEVSEYELLNGTEDVQRRRSEQLAERYLRITRRYRIVQYILYGLALLGCLIGNLAGSGRLDWFFIAATGMMTAASLTLLPAVVCMYPRWESRGASIVAVSFTLSLLLLLLSCCLYTGGRWFAVAAVSVVFGLSLFIAPTVLRQVPVPKWLEGRKLTAYLLAETALLLALLLTCCLYTGGRWFAVAGVSVVFGLSLFIAPAVLRQVPLPKWLEGRKLTAYLLAETALLLALLLACCLYTGGRWFAVAGVSVVFGLSLFIAPAVARQCLRMPPLNRHRLLVCLAAQSLLLLILLAVIDVHTGAHRLLTISLPIALAALTLPWGLLGCGRYLPLNGWRRASLSLVWTALWIWLFPFALDRILAAQFGPSIHPYPLILPFDLLVWDAAHIYWNITALVIFALLLAAIFLLFRPSQRRTVSADD